MRTIVVSGVGLTDAGPFSILQDCASVLDEQLKEDDQVIYLIHQSVADHFSERKHIAFRWPKWLWILRIVFEKLYVMWLEFKLKPTFWISLHDVTPYLLHTPSVVYCHNASPFLKLDTLLYLSNLKVCIFRFFYFWLYRWNIKRNRWVIVQQEWMRKEFETRLDLSSSSIVVAHPTIQSEVGREKSSKPDIETTLVSGAKTLLYPAMARIFKNHAALGKALRQPGTDNVRILLTLSGTENFYARYIRKCFSDVRNLEFLGLLGREKLFELYADVDGLVFPSKLETWGLPLSEFRVTGKPIFAADLPYARETLSDYPNVVFFDPDDTPELTRLLIDFSRGHFRPTPVTVRPDPPFARNWPELLTLLGVTDP